MKSLQHALKTSGTKRVDRASAALPRPALILCGPAECAVRASESGRVCASSHVVGAAALPPPAST